MWWWHLVHGHLLGTSGGQTLLPSGSQGGSSIPGETKAPLQDQGVVSWRKAAASVLIVPQKCDFIIGILEVISAYICGLR